MTFDSRNNANATTYQHCWILRFWGAQAASLSHSAASPNASLCEAQSRTRTEFSPDVRGKLPRTTGWQPMLPGTASHRARIAESGLLFRCNDLPILLHQLEILRRQSGRDIDLSVGNPFVDLQLGDGTSVHKDEEVTTAMFDAHGIKS